MTNYRPPETLADRWLREARSKAGVDTDVIAAVERARHGEAINESRLLRELLELAENLAAFQAGEPTPSSSLEEPAP